MSKSTLSLDEVCDKVKTMSSYNSDAKKTAKLYNLDIVNVTWEDSARFKNSSWGPCISDMTLQVKDYRMPVIRNPNFSDQTWDVSMNKIPLVIGNQNKDNLTKLSTVTLDEYLKNFNKYITQEIDDDINLYRGEKKDSHVIMSSQACFLPIPTGEQTKFNVAIYNYQSKKENPAVLTIVSTSKGTSSQIIEGEDQKLLFNNYGKKADFIAQRLTDNRKERGVKLQGEMTKKEKQDNLILIIQVPLKQKKIKKFNKKIYSYSGYNNYSNSKGFNSFELEEEESEDECYDDDDNLMDFGKGSSQMYQQQESKTRSIKMNSKKKKKTRKT